jgi:lipoprotein-releasing system permease protein
MIEFWLAVRLLFSKKTFGQTNTIVALIGLVIGVACLVVAMAVMSGFETTLRKAVVDVAGHIQVIRTSGGTPDWQDLEKKIFDMDHRLQNSLKFVFLEAVLAHQGETLGVSLQGVDSQKWQQVLNFSKRVVRGNLNLESTDTVPRALIGEGLAKKMHLGLGDKFRIVVPIADTLDPHRFSRRLGEFQVSGILDYGKYEWNERFMIVDLKAAQNLAQIGDRINGLIFKINDLNDTNDVYFNLMSRLGVGYSVRTWRDFNENLFQASQSEKVVIFFVVFIIVLVAAFSVASSFYINVFQRYPDLAILKTLGVKPKALVKVYGIQGILLGLMGTGLGYLLGLTLCFLFVWGQRAFHLMPGSVYRLDEIQVEIKWWDTFSIILSTILICLLASIFPAKKGSRLNPVEGLRYE